MRTTLPAVTALAVAVAVPLTVASPASAAPPKGAACVQAGLGTLKSLGLLQEAAAKQIDYSTLADADQGPIFADLPAGSFLSLGTVVTLHRTDPELFAWCR